MVKIVEEKIINEKREKALKYIKDLKLMAKSAYDLCDPPKDCKKCRDLLTCMNGLRNSIGDLAESVAYNLENIVVLDDCIVDVADETKKTLETKLQNDLNKNKNNVEDKIRSLYT